MAHSMITAATAMHQLQRKMDNIGNNLSNVDTNGYKTRNTEFSSLLYRQINNLSDPANAEARQTPDGIRIGTGARAASMKLDFANGAVQTTSRMLDVALLDEQVYFQISVNDGEETMYTRDGAFYLNPNEAGALQLVTADGNPVLGEDGPIVIDEPFESVSFRDNGEIVIEQAGEQTVAGQLDLVHVIRPHLLEASGDNLFRLEDPGELGFQLGEIIQAPDGTEPVLESGALERSNVDIAQQMTDLIAAQRAYQLNARSLTIGDQMMGLVNQLRS